LQENGDRVEGYHVQVFFWVSLLYTLCTWVAPLYAFNKILIIYL
jgi:hypothetical protein